MRRLALTTWSLALSLVSASAWGQTVTNAAQITYERGPRADTCPDEAAMRNAVAVHIGYDPFRDDATLHIRVAISHPPRQLVARIELRDESGQLVGQRALRSTHADCVELASSIALVLAISIDPVHIGRPVETPPPAAPPPTPTPPPDPPPQAEPTPPPAEPVDNSLAGPPKPDIPLPDAPELAAPQRVVPHRLSAFVGVIGTIEQLPEFGIGGEAGMQYRRGWWGIGLEGFGAFTAGAREANGGGSVVANLFSLSLVPCAESNWVEFCALATLGRFQSSRTDIPGDTRDATYAAIGARLGGHLRITSSIHLRTHIDVYAPLTPIEVRTNGQDFWDSSPVVLIVGTTLFVDFLQ